MDLNVNGTRCKRTSDGFLFLFCVIQEQIL